MSITTFSHHLNGSISNDEMIELYNLIYTVANDFVPSLMSRASAIDDNLLPSAASSKGLSDTKLIDLYVKDVCSQSVILMKKDGCLIGFMAFRHDYISQKIVNLGPCIYISTIALSESYRKDGNGEKLYMELLRLIDNASPVLVRTWSTNFGHLRLLNKLGFRQELVIFNDRGPQVDTVYFKLNSRLLDLI